VTSTGSGAPDERRAGACSLVSAWGPDGSDVAKNPWSSVVIPAPEISTTTVKGVAAPSAMISSRNEGRRP
jgi:hypothetical protein